MRANLTLSAGLSPSIPDRGTRILRGPSDGIRGRSAEEHPSDGDVDDEQNGEWRKIPDEEVQHRHHLKHVHVSEEQVSTSADLRSSLSDTPGFTLTYPVRLTRLRVLQFHVPNRHQVGQVHQR